MSWSQYVVVEKLKCAFEVSREVLKDDAKNFDEYIDKLCSVLSEVDSEIFDTKVKDMTIGDNTDISNIAEKSMFLDYHSETGTLGVYFLLYFLKQRKIDCKIIHEEDFEKDRKTKYKDYIIIRR